MSVDLKKLTEALEKHGHYATFHDSVIYMRIGDARIVYPGTTEEPILAFALLDQLESKGLFVAVRRLPDTEKEPGHTNKDVVYRCALPTMYAHGWTRTEAICNAVIACDEAGLLGGSSGAA